MIVGPGYVSGGDIWRFPNITLCTSGAQLECSIIIGPPLVRHKKHKIYKQNNKTPSDVRLSLFRKLR